MRLTRFLSFTALLALLTVTADATSALAPLAPASAVTGDVVSQAHDTATTPTTASAPAERPASHPAGVLGVVAGLLGLALAGTIRAGESVDGGTLYRPAFETLVDAVPRRIDPSSFKGSAWVDSYGVLKPGTPLKADGTLATNAANPAAFVLPYAVGVAAGSTDAALDAAPNGDVAAATRGDLMRSHIEGNLGRVLTADESAAYTTTGRFVIL